MLLVKAWGWSGDADKKQAHEHHRKHLESLPHTSYPLEPTGDPAQIPAGDLNAGAKTGATAKYQTASGAPYEQR